MLVPQASTAQMVRCAKSEGGRLMARRAWAGLQDIVGNDGTIGPKPGYLTEN